MFYFFWQLNSFCNNCWFLQLGNSFISSIMKSSFSITYVPVADSIFIRKKNVLHYWFMIRIIFCKYLVNHNSPCHVHTITTLLWCWSIFKNIYAFFKKRHQFEASSFRLLIATAECKSKCICFYFHYLWQFLGSTKSWRSNSVHWVVQSIELSNIVFSNKNFISVSYFLHIHSVHLSASNMSRVLPNLLTRKLPAFLCIRDFWRVLSLL